jgi:hypothetical protein
LTPPGIPLEHVTGGAESAGTSAQNAGRTIVAQATLTTTVATLLASKLNEKRRICLILPRRVGFSATPIGPRTFGFNVGQGRIETPPVPLAANVGEGTIIADVLATSLLQLEATRYRRGVD